LLTEGRVISFEPVTTNFTSLKHNVELNDFQHVELHPFGLFDKVAELPIFTSLEETQYSGRNEGLSTLFKDEERQVMEETISLKVFDDLYFDRLERFDFLKIDVEGSELYALKGMARSLEKFKPAILIEMSRQTFEDAGYSVEEMLAFLNGFGYQPYTLFRGKLLKKERISYDDWGNYVFLSH
jgi:FkbM family methyltransferase